MSAFASRPLYRTIAVALLILVVLPLLPAQAATAAEPVAPIVGRQLRLPPPRAAVAAFGGTAEPAVRRTESPIAFSMVGFTLPARHELSFRTSLDGKTWSEWRHPEDEVEIDDAPDAGSPEMRKARRKSPATKRMTEPVWVGEARWLETKVEGPRASRVVPVAHVVDATGLQRTLVQRVADRVVAAWRGTTAGAPAAAAAGRPAIISRRGWGANESWRGTPSYTGKLRAGVVHHTAGSNSYSRSEAAAVVRGTYWYHTHSRGWSDLGYNFLVDRFGRIYEGRAGGANRNVLGAHAGGFNSNTFGVSLMGEFSSAAPSTAMRAAAARLIAWKFSLNGIRPRGTVQLRSAGSTRYAAGRTVTLNTLMGHRDVSTTACPGGRTYDLLGSLRRRVSGLMGSSTPPPPPPPDTSKPDVPTPPPPTATRPAVMFSAHEDRRGAGVLGGKTVRGAIFVWSSWTGSKTRQVQFSLRPADAATRPDHIEYHQPYDLGVVNTHELQDGVHTIVAAVTRNDGTVRRHSAKFVVDNHPESTSWAWRVNSGGGQLIDASRRVWLADTGYVGGEAARNDEDTFTKTDAPQLHADERYGMRGYHVRVPVPGAYKVRLHLSELYWDEPGRRIFSAWAEGAQVLQDYDIVAAQGPRAARVVETSVTVGDGTLDLQFSASVDHAKLAAFEVIRGGSGVPAPPVTSPAPPARLMVSSSRTRAPAVPLDGADLSGYVYIFLDAESADAVSFYVDDPQRTRSPLRTEREAPWDLAGTRDSGNATAYDLNRLGRGEHAVTAVVTKDERTFVVTSTFDVD